MFVTACSPLPPAYHPAVLVRPETCPPGLSYTTENGDHFVKMPLMMETEEERDRRVDTIQTNKLDTQRSYKKFDIPPKTRFIITTTTIVDNHLLHFLIYSVFKNVIIHVDEGTKLSYLFDVIVWMPLSIKDYYRLIKEDKVG